MVSSGIFRINEQEAEIVKEVFEHYLNAESMGRTAKHFEWTSNKVKRILVNKTYIGFIGYKGEWIQGKHKPIITLEQFDKVQEKIAQNALKQVKKIVF